MTARQLAAKEQSPGTAASPGGPGVDGSFGRPLIGPWVAPGRLRLLVLLLACVSLAAFAAAAVQFRLLSRTQEIDVPLDSADYLTADGVVCGRVGKGPPPRTLRWDGEPPRARLVDLATEQTVAPPLLSERTFSLCRRGVLWTANGDCRFTLDQATLAATQGRLALRAELSPSSCAFYLCVLLGLVTALGGGGLLCYARIRAASSGSNSPWKLDGFRWLTFVALSLIAFLAFYPGVPLSGASSDAANIHAFAAGLDSPSTFQRDALLADQRNFAWYTPVYVGFVRAFGRIGFHYGTSAAPLALFCTLAGLAGYFTVFRIVSRSRPFAFAAAMGLWFLRAGYPPEENWSPELILPRTVFAALLPWVVWLTLRHLRRPRTWSIPAVASALLFYVHPVSSPALTGAVTMSLLIAGPGRFPRRIGYAALAAAAALAAMTPYALIYAGKYAGTVAPDPALMARAVEITRQRLAPGFLDFGLFLQQVLGMLATRPRYWPALLAVIWLVSRSRHRRSVRVLVGMALGYFVVTFAIPAADLMTAASLGRLPFQVDLVRNIRYIDVFALAVLGLTLREIRAGRLPREWPRALRRGMYALGRRTSLRPGLATALTLLLLFYGASAAKSWRGLAGRCATNLAVLSGEPPADVADDLELVRALQSLRRPDEVVAGPLHLRQANIPLTYLYKDLGAFAYANPAELVKCKTLLEASKPFLAWPLSTERAVHLSETLGAELLVFDRERVAPSLARSDAVVFENAPTIVVRASEIRPSRGILQLLVRNVQRDTSRGNRPVIDVLRFDDTRLLNWRRLARRAWDLLGLSRRPTLLPDAWNTRCLWSLMEDERLRAMLP